LTGLLEVGRGEKAVGSIKVGEDADKRPVELPFLVARGVEDGPRLVVNAGVHGDELSGVAIVRRVLSEVEVEQLRGTVIGVPVVNVMAYDAGLRWDPADPKDMNRRFPGDSGGSLTDRLAHLFFHEIALSADYIIDLHSGDLAEVFHPHARVRCRDGSGRSMMLIHAFGVELLWERERLEGMLQVSAVRQGVPAITVEIGGGGVAEPHMVDLGVEGVHNVMRVLGMMPGFAEVPEYQIRLATRRPWLRSPVAGIFRSELRLGDVVEEDEVIGRVLNPWSFEEHEIRSPSRGIVAGVRTNPVVRSGSRVLFLLTYGRSEAGFGISSRHLIKVPKLPNARYRENRLLERIMETEGRSGHGD